MANHLDLEEQEQLDQLKHFWTQYGNLITWALIAVLGVIVSWNGYQMWQRNQSVQAAAMYDEVERLVKVGDPQKADRAFQDMKDRFSSALFTQQAGLMVSKLAYESGKTDSSKAILGWVAENGSDKGYSSAARLRLSAILMESKSYDEAFKILSSGISLEYEALADDRRGDILMLQGKKSEAKAEYQKAYHALDDQSEYRRLILVKLNALGVNPVVVEKAATTTETSK